MRTGRFKAPSEHPAAYYHCISRIIDKAHRLGDLEKEQMICDMRLYEEFGGLQVVTFCIMSNHFHILVEVPRRPEVLPTDEELFEMLRKLYGEAAGEHVQHLRHLRKLGAHEEAETYRERFFRRMWDVSEFMKSLKQNFSQRYNRAYGRCGGLWEGRFKSVLVEGGGEAVMAMAAYIDLNPVRAGMVEDPKNYRWCGYAEAMAGNKRALQGLALVNEAQSNVHGGYDRLGKRIGNFPPGVSHADLDPKTLRKQVLAHYRVLLFEIGHQGKVYENGWPCRRGFDLERVKEVLAKQGKISLGEALRCRVRYFADGAVLGTREFVEEIFQHQRHRFGHNRTCGARPIREISDWEIMTCRALRRDPLG